MLTYVIGACLLSTAVWGAACPQPGPENCTESCTEGNCSTATPTARLEAAPCNGSCPPPPVSSTSRLLPGVDAVSSNSSEEKPLSTTTKFSPSPFLGAISEHAPSVVVGEVFRESLGPRPLPRQGGSQLRGYNSGVDYSSGGGYQSEGFRPHAVEIQIAGTGYRPQPTAYGEPDIEIRPQAGGKTEIEIRPFGQQHKPLGAYAEKGGQHFDRPPTATQVVYDRPATTQAVYERPAPTQAGYERQGLSQGSYERAPQKGKTAQHREYPPKPYDPGNAIDYTGYPDTKPRQTYQEAANNFFRPNKGSGPYFFEDNFQEKPIQETTIDEPGRIPFPPVGPGQLETDSSHKHIHEHRGSNKWKGLLRFLTTVLPIGLLFAALTPNVLVVSPTEAPSGTGKGSARPPGSKKSLESPLGPCGLRRLCEALADSPADFQQFLNAAKQGSTEELRTLIKKAEEKNCSAIGCEQELELRPTRPTYRTKDKPIRLPRRKGKPTRLPRTKGKPTRLQKTRNNPN